MNRNEIESDPHSLLEGMIIGGYVMGATEGIIYVRAEYPLAVHRLNRAIEQAREYGLLGENILGRGFKFDIELVEGAGAFVCGEETALIASLEGEAGRPRPRPPFPAQKGLWGKPTNINNVETWYNIAPIVMRGPAWFTETGSPKSSGTKVFSLVGKVKNTGLVEMPLGTPLKTFIYDIGEGAVGGRQVKAVQTGGPSGGCIPQDMFDTAGRLRKPGAAWLHHGLGRHGRDGRRQLHGRRRPLLHRVHPFGIVWKMHSVPRRAEQVPAHSEPRYGRRRNHTSSRDPGRTEPLHPRLLALRTRTDSAESRTHDPAAFPRTSSKTTFSRTAARPACARNWLSRHVRTAARST